MRTSTWQVEGTSVYDMVPGFRQLFNLFEIELNRWPDSKEIESLVDLVYQDKILEQVSPRIAAALTLDRSVLADTRVTNYLKSSGMMNQFHLRSVREQHKAHRPVGSVIALQLGGNAFKMEQQIRLMRYADLEYGGFVALASNIRQCNSKAESEHWAVMAFRARNNKRFPYQWELQAALLEREGFPAFRSFHDHDSLEDNIREFAINREMQLGNIAVFASAPDTYVPLLVRRILRRYWRGFDVNLDKFWFCQSPGQLPTVDWQIRKPEKYTRPLDIVKSMVLLVRELYFLNGSKPFKSTA